MSDEKPPQPKTVELPAMTDRAILEEVARSSRLTKENVERLTLTVDGLVGDHQSLHARVGFIEGRVAKLEAPPSVPPPPPITSERVKGIIEGHPSQMNLEQQAKLAEVIAKDMDRDRKIEETHALAINAATKADVQALADSTATKAEVKELVETVADDQTKAIVKGVKDAITETVDRATQNKTVRRLAQAFVVLAFLAINAATTYLMSRAHTAPATPQLHEVTK